MKEYTLLALISVAAAVAVDKGFKTGLLRKKLFWLFLAVIACFKFVVNGKLTGSQIVLYNPDFYLGYRLGSIPLEDFFFGFSMIVLSIVLWEYFKRRGF